MQTNLVLTVIGDDKPGLVESLSRVIADNGGNWEESSMSQLAGKFAGILRVSVASEQSNALVAELQKLSDDLRLVIEQANTLESSEPPRTVRLNLVGNDRPGIVRDLAAVVADHGGIVREISHALALLSVNVEQLNTECSPAPMSSDLLFRTRATLKVPRDLALDVLQEELERLADDLIVEIRIEEATQ